MGKGICYTMRLKLIKKNYWKSYSHTPSELKRSRS